MRHDRWLTADLEAGFSAVGRAGVSSAAEIRGVAPSLASAVEGLQATLATEKFAIVNVVRVCRTAAEFHRCCVALGVLLGELVVQNADGATVVEVYDRGIGRIQDGVRYHQTRQGGDLHTDSVNHPLAFQYILLGCIAPARLGGESIIVRAADVCAALAAMPDVLTTLREPFWFEGRGMGADVSLFQMPVLSHEHGNPRFRYLRSYVESAHVKAGQPLTADQGFAFDALDAALESSALQHRFQLTRGDILICLDLEVFHGRTGFVDTLDHAGVWASQRRMLRLWVR